jgi:hypothetical protein
MSWSEIKKAIDILTIPYSDIITGTISYQQEVTITGCGWIYSYSTDSTGYLFGSIDDMKIPTMSVFLVHKGGNYSGEGHIYHIPFSKSVTLQNSQNVLEYYVVIVPKRIGGGGA